MMSATGAEPHSCDTEEGSAPLLAKRLEIAPETCRLPSWRLPMLVLGVVLAVWAASAHFTQQAPPVITGQHPTRQVTMLSLTEKVHSKHCASATEDCTPLQCCAAPGMQCYETKAGKAACLESCDGETDDWTCKAIGKRNLESTCSWASENCSLTRCCNNEGFVCALQGTYLASCTQTTEKSRWISQHTGKNLSVPNRKILGKGRSEHQIQPVSKGGSIAGISLFCLMVFLPNTTEEKLMQLAQKNRASIFSCNSSMVHHAWRSDDLWSEDSESPLINTDVFLDAWEAVRRDGQYAEHDWTVKVDPDCVFFADRLRSHLRALRPPPGAALYVKNNDMERGLGNNGFLGAIEVFSTSAMETYFANSDGCQRTLGVNCGEDNFFKKCMDALDVGFMTDPTIFAPEDNLQACQKNERVAFHPIKEAQEWQCCVDIVMGVKREVKYGKCDSPKSVRRDWMHT